MPIFTAPYFGAPDFVTSHPQLSLFPNARMTKMAVCESAAKSLSTLLHSGGDRIYGLWVGYK